MKIGNSAELRQFLLDQMVATALGKVEPAAAKSVCNFAQQIYNTVKLEMQFAQLKNKEGIKTVEAVSWNGSSESQTRRLRSK